MNGRVSAANARSVIRALERAGFTVVRVSGSHHLLIHPEDLSRRVTVPRHGARSLPRGLPSRLLRAIIRQSGLSVQAFNELL